ncbi:MAG: helix-turn-helix transcriptional regulator [Anaerocolumna sp.]
MSNSNITGIKIIMEYIQENYRKKLYINELATQVNMSVDNYYKFFRKATGRTPTEYINLY